MVDESTAGCRNKMLHLPSEKVTIPYLTSDFGLTKIQSIYSTVLPCLSMLLMALLTAENDSERRRKKAKVGKIDRAQAVIVVIISILLYVRNRGSNAFPLILGIFLASTGTSRRVIDTFNRIGLSIGYDAIQSSLLGLSNDAKVRAHEFIATSNQLWGVVYDNINFTLRPSSQRLDSATRQINATTVAVFSFPKRFTRRAYASALDILERNRGRSSRSNFTVDKLLPSEEAQEAARKAFKYAVSSILLSHGPGYLGRRKKTRAIRKMVKKMKPRIRQLDHEKTQFFPLPALNEEEASVGGTIRVVEAIFLKLLSLAEDVIDTELRLMVGDWLTIRNLRLMRQERKYEFSRFLRFDWIQEAAMPFHFQLNAMYALFRTHLGSTAEAMSNPSSLEHHRSILRRSKLDPKKPEYNKAKELAMHSLTSRLLDCLRVVLKIDSYHDLAKWKPSPKEFEAAVDEIVDRFTNSDAAKTALKSGDEVLAHSILFIRDALFFWGFCDAIRDADVGRMWVVYDFWVFAMRGAGCNNYGNELLEMKAQFEYEFPPLLREVVERTWLVNRWGKRGRSIPTDLYLEHNNGFLKNMFAAIGSGSSIQFIQDKSSACVEVLRLFAHQMAEWFGKTDINRRHMEVSIVADIAAIGLDLAENRVHELTVGRFIQAPDLAGRKKRKKVVVCDVITEGMKLLVEKDQFTQWKQRSLNPEAFDNETDTNNDSTSTALDPLEPVDGFANPNGILEVDTAEDMEFISDNPFSALQFNDNE
ncbi:hypothetical protein MD484_g8897, partial [Candolleomyces efflorescens]